MYSGTEKWWANKDILTLSVTECSSQIDVKWAFYKCRVSGPTLDLMIHNLCLNSIPMWFVFTLKFEKHCYEEQEGRRQVKGSEYENITIYTGKLLFQNNFWEYQKAVSNEKVSHMYIWGKLLQKENNQSKGLELEQDGKISRRLIKPKQRAGVHVAKQWKTFLCPT